MSQAFISYHRAQSKLARLIAHRVAADGHSVWWDRSDRPGDEWSEAVATALANSACVIVIWSKQAAASPVIMGEATAGYGRGALVSVVTDRTPPPSPFDRAPVIDMQDWQGESADLAWIRLREPLRAKLQAAERIEAENAPLPPPRPQPVRVGFSSAAAMAPPPSYEEERSGSPARTLVTLLLLGGLGGAGWVYRDQIQERLEAMREAASAPTEAPAERTAVGPAATAPIPPARPPAQVAEAPLAATPADPAPAPEETAAPAKGRDLGPAPQMTITYEQWRDGYVPAPMARTAPRPAPSPTATSATLEVPAPPPAPPAPVPPRILTIVAGQAVDIDHVGDRRTDLWFAKDSTGYGPLLGVANGARLGVVDATRATPEGCGTGNLQRAPIPVRQVSAGRVVCVRSSAGAVSAWRIDGVDRTGSRYTLRLRPIG